MAQHSPGGIILPNPANWNRQLSAADFSWYPSQLIGKLPCRIPPLLQSMSWAVTSARNSPAGAGRWQCPQVHRSHSTDFPSTALKRTLQSYLGNTTRERKLDLKISLNSPFAQPNQIIIMKKHCRIKIWIVGFFLWCWKPRTIKAARYNFFFPGVPWFFRIACTLLAPLSSHINTIDCLLGR